MTAPTSLSPAERETILNLDDESGVVRIWTAQRTVITALRKRASAGVQEIASGHHGTTEWAEFTFDTGADGAGTFNLGRAFAKRPTLSPEQRAASAERMRRVRGA